MGQGARADRVGDQIRSEISDMIARELHDPGVGFVTITRVHVSPDLHHARVYYTTLGSQAARANTERALARAAAFMRRQLGQRLRLRRAPELDFVFDESIERQSRIEQLLQDLSRRNDEDAPGAAADTSRRSSDDVSVDADPDIASDKDDSDT
jgi:ribosome-binding factor A